MASPTARRPLPDNDFHNYSLQTSLYAEMLSKSHGIEANTFIAVAVSKCVETPYNIQGLANHRRVARQVLDAERR